MCGGQEHRRAFAERYGRHLVDRYGEWWTQLLGLSRRGSDAVPKLTQIRRSCKVSDLVSEVTRLTSTLGSGGGAVERLAGLFGVTDEDQEQALGERERWMAPLRDQADALSCPALDSILGRSARG